LRTNNYAATLKDRERVRRLRRAQTDLYWLATEILGYDLLTRDFHKPMMDEMDERRKMRSAGRFKKHEGEMWARDHYKTSVREAQVVQDYLNDPEDTLIWWHAVEEQASEAGQHVGAFFQKNKDLRALCPQMMPATSTKKFVTAKGFDLPRAIGSTRKAASFRAWGAGSEATGGHARRGYLDDIIGNNDIEDNLMPRKTRWFGRTVKNVIRTGCPLFLTGTHWDPNDIYAKLQKRRNWTFRMRACYETDGVPDWNGVPVLFTRDEIESKREDMSEYEFGCQMMNDPAIKSDRLWQPEYETDMFVPLKYAAGRGTVVQLSDPAPAGVGSFDGRGEKQRQDGSKNYWAIATVKWVLKGSQMVMVLLDGASSKDWGKDEGFGLCCTQAKHWGTPYIANEAIGNAIALYSEDLAKAATKHGLSIYYDPKTKTPGVRLESTYKGKNMQFESLRTLALRGQFKISSQCPKGFVDKFLYQVRNWRCLDNGRNSLPFDDEANVVCFGVDPAVKRLAPTAKLFDPTEEEADEWLTGYRKRSRYCGSY